MENLLNLKVEKELHKSLNTKNLKEMKKVKDTLPTFDTKILYNLINILNKKYLIIFLINRIHIQKLIKKFVYRLSTILKIFYKQYLLNE